MGVEKFWRKVVLRGPLQFTTAASQVIPGATSISLRNNANSADNLIITDAGAATVRAGLTVTAGGATITAGGVTISTGALTQGAAGGAGSIVSLAKTITALADNTATDLCTVTVPNQICGAAIRVSAVGMLGDGDSTDSKIYMIGVSRIAGAATKAVASTAAAVGATTGATGNAALTISVSTNTGANGATQTFTIQGKVARSAGTATNHIIVAEIELLNATATGVTVA